MCGFLYHVKLVVSAFLRKISNGDYEASTKLAELFTENLDNPVIEIGLSALNPVAPTPIPKLSSSSEPVDWF